MLCRVLRAGGGVHARAQAWHPPAVDAAAGSQPEARKSAAEAAPPAVRREAESEKRIEEAGRAAYQQGEAAGRKAGMAAAQAELGPVLERLGAAIEETARLRGRLLHDVEKDVLRLSVAIARRILRRELSVDQDAMAGIVRSALEKLENQEVTRVRAHPVHEPFIRALLERSGVPAEVHPDASLPAGGIVVETRRGNLDASLETQLSEIERGLTDRLEA